MEEVVKEMYEDFVISEALSRFYGFSQWGCEDEAQKWNWFLEYDKHAETCKKAAEACLEFLNTKDVNTLILRLNVLGFKENSLTLTQQNLK